MASALKTETPAEIHTPMMRQTEDLVRQNLINQGHKPETANIIISMASVQLKGKDIQVPQKLRGAVNEARDLLHFMPKLMGKGYGAVEAFSMVDAARHPIDMTLFSSGRIDDYDISTLKERFDYMKSHPKEDYRAAMTGLMFKGPAKVPMTREKAPSAPKTEVAEKESYLQLGGRLAMVPRKLPSQDDLMVFTRGQTKPPEEMPVSKKEGTVAVVEARGPKKSSDVLAPRTYAYDVDVFGQKYYVTLDRELDRAGLKAAFSTVLQGAPAAVLSVTTPSGEVVTDASGLRSNISYLKSVASRGKGIEVAPLMLFTEKETKEPKKEQPVADFAEKNTGTERTQMPAANFSYTVDTYGQKYTITLNRPLEGDDRKAALFNVLKNDNGAVVSVVTTDDIKVTKNTRVGLDQYLAYLASEFASFRNVLIVSPVDVPAESVRDTTLGNKPGAKNRPGEMARVHVYTLDTSQDTYAIALNKPLEGNDMKAALLDVLRKDSKAKVPATVVSITTSNNMTITPSIPVFKGYLSYILSQYRSFMDESKVEPK